MITALKVLANAIQEPGSIDGDGDIGALQLGFEVLGYV